MDVGIQLERAGVLFTRLIAIVSSLLGFYLILEGGSLLHLLFGIVLVWIGLFMLLHHHLVWSRGSMKGDSGG